MRLFASLLLLCIALVNFSCAGSPARYESDTKYLEKAGKPGRKSIARLKILSPDMGEMDSGHFMTGGNAGEFTSPFFPALVFEGDIEEPDNSSPGFVFYINRVRLFANWPNGWTEGVYEASGKFSFIPRGDMFTCVVEDPFELWDIIKGEVRYYNTFYRNDDGVWKVKNRVDRITEISRILKEKYCDPFYGHIKRTTPYGRSFRWDITKVLFPERYDFTYFEKKDLLPPPFYENKDNADKKTLWGADLWWRSDYTQAVFPEHLWQLRDSGTLWRDFEEAPLLFFSLYNLEYFFGSLLPDNQFIRID